MKEEQKEKLKDITRTVLEILGAVAILSVTVVAPNAVMIFDQFGKKYSKYPKDKFRRNMYYTRLTHN